MSSAVLITQVDAFTSEAFSGNPAAVCVLPHARDEAWMQSVAKEMNLSETAFLVRRPDDTFDLRWFTPAVEVAPEAYLAGSVELDAGKVREVKKPILR